MIKEINNRIFEITDDLLSDLESYLHSEGEGGKVIVASFMEEFSALSERSPQDDPTNIKNFLPLIEQHVKETLDSSLTVSKDGSVNFGIGTDEFLGFTVDREKLKHKPTPTAWVVYLIRGIGGRYAFVNESTYQKKWDQPMPSEYAGGFLISKQAWENEGWDRVVGPFESFEHPASGASTIPFFKNVLDRVNISDLVSKFLESKIKN